MTLPITPPAAPVVPLYPPLGSATFNADAYAYGTAMPGVVDGVNALAVNAYANAVSAAEDVQVSELAADRATDKAQEALLSANAAASHASNASAAKRDAEAVYDNFDDRYLGAKSFDPATDNDGGALLVGALYFRTGGAPGMRVWTGASWEDGYTNLASKFDKAGGEITGSIGVAGIITARRPSPGVAGIIAIEEVGTGIANFNLQKNSFTPDRAEILHTATGGSLVLAQSGSGSIQALVDGQEILTLTGSGALVKTGALGYGVGAGGTVTQATSKSTAVTLNKPSGLITMAQGAIPANGAAMFQVSNNTVSQGDTVSVCLISGITTDGAGYIVDVQAPTIGLFIVVVRNVTGTATPSADQPAIQFNVHKGSRS